MLVTNKEKELLKRMYEMDTHFMGSDKASYAEWLEFRVVHYMREMEKVKEVRKSLRTVGEWVK